MAGLAAAWRLSDLGRCVRVLEKSRGIGGRLATRRTRDGLTFDHGAQFAKARDAGFAGYLDQARRAGAAADWTPLGPDGAEGALPVGLPGMSGLVAPLARGIEIGFAATVTGLSAGDGWVVEGEGFDTFEVSAVLLAIPAAQAQSLLRPVAPQTAGELDRVEMDPCLAAMVAFDAPLATPVGLWRDPSPSLQWVSRENAKPGRADGVDRWVVHGAPRWSREHLERDKDETAAMILPMAADVWRRAGAAVPEPARLIGHRWRYARTRRPLGRPFLADASGTLLAGGDWALGPRVEAAYLSGIAMADALRR